MIPPKKLRPVAALIVKKGNKYLLVQKPRKNNAWQFPQGGVDPGETHAEAALRELAEECGSDIKVEIDSKPIGNYEYPFPEDFVRHYGEFFGAKVVFFKAKYLSGEVHVDGKELVGFKWLEAEKIKEYVAEKYWNNTKRFITKSQGAVRSILGGILEFLAFFSLFND
jgi:8-oxo-dGTP pyrophosphatase MutT (NUDIX family)